MKKFALILALVMALSMFAGCASNGDSETTEGGSSVVTAPEGTATELMDKVYENVTVELALVNETLDVSDAEMISYLTAIESGEGMVDVTVSMPMMGSQAYHVVLIRCESNEKAAELAQAMYDNMDMARWICVQATEKQAVVCGDLAFFVMLDPKYGVTSDQIVEAFTTVCGGTVDSVIK